MPIGDKFYQSPPGSGSNDGALPTVYDPQWQLFVNLSPAQIIAFQAFPKDLLFYLRSRYRQAEQSGITVAGIPLNTTPADQTKISQMLQAFREGVVTTVAFEDGAGNWHNINATQATGVYRAVAGFIAQVQAVAQGLASGINAVPPTITTRKQIDAAIAAVAPNSLSATNPSPN